MEARGANGNVGNGHANGGVFGSSEPSRHRTRGKRQLSASTDQLQDLNPRKRNTLHHDGQFGPTQPRFTNPPSASKAAVANGAAEGIYSDFYDFAESEFDNADFELNLLNADNSAQTTEPSALQVPNEEIWQFFSVPPSLNSNEPPSSVLREFDNVSISTTTPTQFDPTLQFSPPNSVSPTIDEVIGDGKGVGEEVSWEFVNGPLQRIYTERCEELRQSYRNPRCRPPAWTPASDVTVNRHFPSRRDASPAL